MAMAIEEKNALIESAVITTEDHGVLSAWLYLKYSAGSGQGFGGHILYVPRDFGHHAGQANLAGHFIYRVLEIAGVGKWENLGGKTIRVRADRGKVHEIGHIINDEWFNPQTEYSQLTGPVLESRSA